MRSIVNVAWLRQALKLSLTALLVYYCLTLISIEQVIEIIKNTDSPLLFAGFLGVILGTVVCKTLIVWYSLSTLHKVKFTQLLQINFAMRFYTMILPKPIVAGIRWNKYRKISDPKNALIILIFEALFALTISAFAASLFMGLEEQSVIPTWIKETFLVICVLLTISIYVLFFHPSTGFVIKLEAMLQKQGPLSMFAKLINKWRLAAELLHLSKLKNTLTIFFLSILSHSVFILGAYFLLLSLHVELSFIAVAWIRSVVFILASLPISLAGLGVREVGFIALFNFYGVDSNAAVAYGLLVFAVQLAVGFLGLIVETKSWMMEKQLREK